MKGAKYYLRAKITQFSISKRLRQIDNVKFGEYILPDHKNCDHKNSQESWMSFTTLSGKQESKIVLSCKDCDKILIKKSLSHKFIDFKTKK